MIYNIVLSTSALTKAVDNKDVIECVVSDLLKLDNCYAFLDDSSGFRETNSGNCLKSESYLPLTVKKVTVNKKMYEPCQAEIDILIDGNKKISDYESLIGQQFNILEAANVGNDYKTNLSCMNYIVYGFSPYKKSGEKSPYIKLQLYSHDKIMDIEPYSRTYHSQALGKDILVSNGADEFKLDEDFFSINAITTKTGSKNTVSKTTKSTKIEYKSFYTNDYDIQKRTADSFHGISGASEDKIQDYINDCNNVLESKIEGDKVSRIIYNDTPKSATTKNADVICYEYQSDYYSKPRSANVTVKSNDSESSYEYKDESTKLESTLSFKVYKREVPVGKNAAASFLPDYSDVKKNKAVLKDKNDMCSQWEALWKSIDDIDDSMSKYCEDINNYRNAPEYSTVLSNDFKSEIDKCYQDYTSEKEKYDTQKDAYRKEDSYKTNETTETNYWNEYANYFKIIDNFNSAVQSEKDRQSGDLQAGTAATPSGVTPICEHLELSSTSYDTLSKGKKAVSEQKDKYVTSRETLKATAGSNGNTDPMSMELRILEIVRVQTDTTQTNDNYVYSEYLQPHLVQYNETFYHFMARTANRCGEFLYFEDGVMHYGLKEAECNYPLEDQSNCIEYPRQFFTNNAENGLLVKDRSHNYSTGKNVDTDGSGNLFRNNEVGNDDQITPIDAESDYMTLEDVNPLGCIIVDTVAAGLSGSNMIESIVDATEEYVGGKLIRSTIQETLKEEMGGDDGLAKKENQQFMLDSKENKLTSKKYAEFKQKEQAASSSTITINLSKTYNPCKLGSKISVDSNSYVVTDINVVYENKAEKDEQGKEELKLSCEHIIKAVKYITEDGKEIAYPPYMGYEVLKSSPQKATVTDVADPLRIGRVKVQYYWDTESDSTTWVRVCVPAAYDGGGFMFTPEEGDEVMIDYEDGNIEKPFVCGFMHTKSHKPYIGPKATYTKGAAYKIAKTNSSIISNKTGQIISLNNGADGTNFLKGALPSFITNWVKAAVSDNNPLKENTCLDGGITLTDCYGVFNIECSTSGKSITIDSPVGSVEMNAFTGITISAPNGDIKIEGKNISLEAGNKVTIKSGTNVEYLADKKALKSAAVGVLSAKASSVVNTIASQYCTNWVSKVIDVSYLRCVTEVILRPVNGTLELNSTRFMTLNAGGATAAPSKSEYNTDDYKKGPNLVKKLKDKAKGTKAKEDALQVRYENMNSNVRDVSSLVELIFNNYDLAMRNLKGEIAKLENLSINKWGSTDTAPIKPNEIMSKNSVDDVVTYIKEKTAYPNDNPPAEPGNPPEPVQQEGGQGQAAPVSPAQLKNYQKSWSDYSVWKSWEAKQCEITTIAKKILENYNTLKQKADENVSNTLNGANGIGDGTITADNAKRIIVARLGTDNDAINNYDKFTSKANCILAQRLCIKEFIDREPKINDDIQLEQDASNWEEYVNNFSFERDNDGYGWGNLAEDLADAALKYTGLDSLNGYIDSLYENVANFKMKEGGSILFADKQGKTFEFSPSGSINTVDNGVTNKTILINTLKGIK